MSDLHIECRLMDSWHGPHTDKRIKAPFGGNWAMTLQKLEYELGHLGADRAIIELSGDVRIRHDGWPYGSDTPDPPVAMSFASTHGPLRYQTDVYDRWKDNVHAIALTLDRLRAVDRYGTTSRAEQYTGFSALPAGGQSTAPNPVAWVAEYIGFAVEEVEDNPRAAVKLARKSAHPDAGGSDEAFLIVQDAARLLGVVS